jgi:hypothetical protein
MEAYTIEDVELLRKKGGMTYQEAVALLEYHNGNLARALIDLEKNGRLKEDAPADRGTAYGTAKGNGKKHSETREKAINLLQKLYRCRVKVHKGDVPVINLSAVYAGAVLVFAPYITVAGIIIAMILGYRFSVSQMDGDFTVDSLKQAVKNTAGNVKASVNSMADSASRKAAEAETPATPEAMAEAEAPAAPEAMAEVEAPAAPEPCVEIELPVDPDDISLRVPTIQVPVRA